MHVLFTDLLTSATDFTAFADGIAEPMSCSIGRIRELCL
jgi:hypothetical protein